MSVNQNKTISMLSLVKEIIKDYPIVMYKQLKFSLHNISSIIMLFSLPFIIVILTGLTVFVLSIVFVPLCITIILKPSYFKSKLKKKIIEYYNNKA